MSPVSSTCLSCGALNGADFDRCIRCGAGLSRSTAGVDRLGAHVSGDGHRATKLIVGLTLLVFALQCASALARSAGGDAFAVLMRGGDALRFGAIKLGALDGPLRFVSAIFVHFGVLHIVMNMVALVDLGRIAEPAVGTARFVIAYVASGVAGFVLAVGWAVYQGEWLTVAGASGAILGLMGLVIGILARRRDPRWKDFAMRALFYGVIFGFLVNAGNSGFRISNASHIGGLVMGTLLGAIFAGTRPRVREPRADLAVNVLAVLAALGCLAALLTAPIG